LKNLIKLLILSAFALFTFQVKAQQDIASAGGYYEGANVSLCFTPGEPVTETF